MALNLVTVTGVCPETARTRRVWELRVLDAVAAGPTPPVPLKQFKPKFPNIPVRVEYRRGRRAARRRVRPAPSVTLSSLPGQPDITPIFPRSFGTV